MNQIVDTIVALATPPGRGSIGILRISGPLSSKIAYLLLNKLPRPRQAEYLPFLDNEGAIIDCGIALFFPSPNSFTGEDTLELHSHGGPVVLDMLMQRIVAISGIRIASPGEFSERAFLNNKIDLAQAEAIADLIDASSSQAARSAINSLQGVFSNRIYKIKESISDLRKHVEAIINFPDEEIDFLSEHNIKVMLNNIISSLEKLYNEARCGNLLRTGMKVVIAGKPNVGKSSLINILVGREIAIVTDIAGTTRDILHEYINIDGIPLHIVDTAGLHDTTNKVECIGIERAWHEIKKADHVLLMVDSTITSINEHETIWSEFISHLPSVVPITIVRNKADIAGEKINFKDAGNYSIITISALSGAGLDLLRNHLKQSIGFTDNTENVFLARQRHIDALKNSIITLQQVKRKLEQLANNYSSELLADDLSLAHRYLKEITGEYSSDTLLKEIFSNFCIGK